ncbi:MAG: FAD:protein FMN transferase [Clostridiales bacterium]|nr:FAD:protein FMN transferase [Clostridiales bacterium]
MSRAKKIAIPALAALVFAAAASCGYGRKYYEATEIVFSKSISVSVRLSGPDPKGAFSEMLSVINGIDGEISPANPDSALYYLNETAAPGERVEISGTVYDLMTLSVELETVTDGAFSIAVNNLSRLWKLDIAGYSAFDPAVDGPLKHALPTPDRVAEAKGDCDITALRLTEDGGKYYMSKTNKNLRLDLGGVAKGYCADLCLGIMDARGITSGLVNISGNIVVKGKKLGGAAWDIRVRSPRPRFTPLRGEVCALSSYGDVSIVTSGDYMRYYVHESGITPSHIIDPRSGAPAGIVYGQGGWEQAGEYVSSATVLAKSSARADAYSTAVCAMGFEAGAKWLKSRRESGETDVAAIIFSERYDGKEETRGDMSVIGAIELALTDTVNEYERYGQREW